MSVADRHQRADHPIGCAVLTVSDTRTPDTDHSGDAIGTLIETAGHLIVVRTLVPDDPAPVSSTIRAWAARHDVRVIITTGGTGIARRDTTPDTLTPLFDIALDGFGELFRALSFREIGAAAMLSRATAGIIGDTAIFVLPGSEHAVRLALEQLIIPELPHIARELTRTR